MDAKPRAFGAEESDRSGPTGTSHDVGGVDHAHLGGRTIVLLALLTSFFLVIIVRLIHWQLGGAVSSASSTTNTAVDTSRGRIVDRNGQLLATDSFTWDVYANPLEIQKDQLGPTLAVSLTQILSTEGATVPVETIRASLASTLPMVSLAKGVPESQIAGIKALGAQIRNPYLVWADDRRIRAYPQGSLAAHVLGFTNYEQHGVYGVEASYDPWLRTDGEWSGQLPAEGAAPAGAPLPDSWKLYLPSPGGRDLVLHLDAPLQQVAERRLAEAVAQYEAQSGCIIAMDPRTGGILALANYPTFDPNRYSEAPTQTWINAAVSDLYEPGSVFKLVTFAGGLDSGQITPDKHFYDSGALTVGNRYIRNSEYRAYGDVTATEALAHSLNVVAAKIALDEGSDTFYRYIRQFGFGKLTEVDLDAESFGIVKEPDNKYWSLFDQATNSFGQALSATALQMLNATAAIANNGTRLQPQIVRGMIQDGRIYTLAPRVLGDAIKPEAARGADADDGVHGRQLALSQARAGLSSGRQDRNRGNPDRDRLYIAGDHHELRRLPAGGRSSGRDLGEIGQAQAFAVGRAGCHAHLRAIRAGCGAHPAHPA